MKTIKASEFKAKCLKLMDEVAATGEPLLITKHGKPVARLLPIYSESAELLGALEEKLEITGDILSTGLAWDAQS